jgi:glycosyltransferase involved in cell wall biosynthesis
MWCGRVEYGTKRLDRMLSIWKRVCERFPDWELIIMGSGDTTRFEALVHKHGIQHVRFIGFCNPFDWYEKGKILCVTSSAEGWGLTLVEAMSQGCATMAYGSYAAVHDIINDGKTGYIVPPYNEKLFAEHLAQLMENEGMCAQMGMAGKESLHRFDIHTTAQKYIDVFSEVIRQ